MTDIVKGQTEKVASSQQLIDFFNLTPELTGKLYIGYPILYSGGESIVLDALWISPEFGLVVFDLIEGTEMPENRNEHRDHLYNKIRSQLLSYSNLSSGRNFLVNIEVITFAPACSIEFIADLVAVNNVSLHEEIKKFSAWPNPELFSKVISVVQSVTQLKASIDRGYVSKEYSKGWIVKHLEQTIANLDNQQEEAVIEYFDGIQRIRGLAGSGKTIVLALKAAYLHARNPDWKIAVTFNTRSLKDQFKDLIELFCVQKMGKKPNEEKINILHAWGSSSSPGIYYNFCKTNSLEYFDFNTARQYSNHMGQRGTPPLEVVSKKAIEELGGKQIEPVYDAILVDEAQDLSESFLNLCFRLLSDRKRLIYAYDELQKLNEGSPLRSPKVLFDKDASDIILKRCYRNSKPVLVTAHALGFGIYRSGGLAQFFDQPELWEELGYLVKDGELKSGSNVVLMRSDEATHQFINQYVEVDDLIVFKSFQSREEQALEIVNEIQRNISEDELLHRDIIVINPIAITTKDEMAVIRNLLNEKRIKSHIAGDSNPDYFFEKDSIAFTGINRAKGNEVPMVYIINAHECYSHPMFEDRDLIRRRNILFTAITRSKAWVRVYGIGKDMNKLIAEFNEVKRRNFELQFQYPSTEEIVQMNVIRRDISNLEEQKLKKEVDVLKDLNSIISKIRSGKSRIEDYPVEQRDILKKLLEL